MSAPPARAYLVQCDGRGRCCARMKPSIGGDWVLYVAHRAEIERMQREIVALLAIAREIAASCAECMGTGISDTKRYAKAADPSCDDCAHVRAVIARAEGS